jgi:hypothetical protein
MQTWIGKQAPREELKRLDFMVGEFSSWQTLWPTNKRPPVQYRSVVSAHREGCDRFLRLEQFSDVPGIGLVSSTALYTYNRRDAAYEAYGFCSALEEPLRFRGNWEGNRLVMVSNPVAGYGGLERFRQTLTPRGAERWDFLEERWEPEGYVKHILGTYLLGAV